MNISQKIDCLKLAVDLTKFNFSNSNESSSELIDQVADAYDSLCAMIKSIDMDDPSALVDLVDEAAEL